LAAFVLLFALAIAAVAIYVYYRFLRTLRDLLRAVSERNRTMQPGHVWLNFIPLFNIAWIFVTVIKIRDSVRAEFKYRGLRPDGDFGFGVGITFAVTSALSGGSAYSSESLDESVLLVLSVVGGIISLTSFVCWIIYWSGAAHLRNVLNTAVPVPGSLALPDRPSYQPPPWESPLGPPPASSSPGSPPQAVQYPQNQPGPWLSGKQPAGPAQQAAGAEAPTESSASATVTCPHCGAVYRQGAGYCWACGKPAAT
jgi:hypothetical protein